LRVLVACEYSGVVRDAFTLAGCDAWSADILPSDSDGNHYQGNVLDIIDDGWDLLIAHPPCTRLANSGVRWLRERSLYEDLIDGAEFFKALWCANIRHVAVENPVPHKYAVDLIGCKYSQTIQPWQFGHGESKRTCLWLKGLPALEATKIVSGREQVMFNLPPTKDRAKIRSKTYRGIAEAMAKQWTPYVLNEIQKDNKRIGGGS